LLRRSGKRRVIWTGDIAARGGFFMARKVALITGASAGLGEQFAHLFARDGHDVILVARTAAKLEALAAKLEQEHQVKAHVLAADLARPEEPQRLFEEVRAQQW